ncbi:methyltransferase domain-containing protein [Nannocystis pusilla]|uniref:Methyltransferase domain-containing protein n=1 Tax=Nannocystis pusilla TaxID=889268 RepID=A0ABS7TKC9_9BACT|nr:methyltransferase domain-containing protein [Nannocystis pusilla]
MDLRSFKLHRPDQHVRAVVVGARGEQGRDLEGPAYARVDAVAGPMWAAFERHAGSPVRAVAVDAFARHATLSLADARRPGLKLPGSEFEAFVDVVAPVARTIRGELIARAPDVPGAGPGEARFWDPMFAADTGGWELGRAAPPLVTWFSEHVPKGMHALVPGCGRGHEARLLAALEATVTAIDLAPTAIAQAQAMTPPGLPITFAVQDLFTRIGQPPAFDLVVEHTCFCAIDPARRDDYVTAVADALQPRGTLVGLFYAHGRPGGPPFTTDRAEVERRFARRFAIEQLEVAQGSTLIRHRQELFAVMRRR